MINLQVLKTFYLCRVFLLKQHVVFHNNTNNLFLNSLLEGNINFMTLGYHCNSYVKYS